MFDISTARRDALIDEWAPKLVRRGWGPAAVFLLEAHKPLSGIGAHGVVLVQPILGPLLSFDLNEVAAFIRQADNVERLIQRVEALEEERKQEEERLRIRRQEIRRRARRIHRIRRRRERQGGDRPA